MEDLKQKVLVIVTKSLAPYRIGLYREVKQALGDGFRVILIAPETSAPDHDWKNLQPEEGKAEGFEFKQISCRFFESKLLASFYRNREKSIRVPLPTTEITEFLDEIQPDIVWTHEFAPYVYPAQKWSKRNGKRLIVSSELGDKGRSKIPYVLRKFQEKALSSVDLLIGNTKDAFCSAQESGLDAIFAPHAVGSLSLSPKRSPQDKFCFLYVGNLLERKGIALILEASAQLVKAGVGFEVHLVGGKSDGDYEGMSKELGLENVVKFKGFLEGADLEQQYQNADCFILPSLYDTYAVVTHEAARAGLPLIVSDAAGSSEVLVEEKVNGVVIRPDSHELLKAMDFVMKGGLPHAKEKSLELARFYSLESSGKGIATKIQQMDKVFGRELDFVIVGAQKAASTFVHRALLDHPETFMVDGETSYFEGEMPSVGLPKEIDSQFRTADVALKVGIKRPDYLASPEVPERVFAHSPQAKIVIVLRNPIQRAVSAYYHYLAGGFLPANDPEKGLRMILEGVENQTPAEKTILKFGDYGEAIERWLKWFPKENCMIRLQEDFIAHPKEEMQSLYQFLDIDDGFVSTNLDRRSQAVVYHLGRAKLLGFVHKHTRYWYPDGLNHKPRLGLVGNGVYWTFLALDRFVLSRLFPSEKRALSGELQNLLFDYYKDDIAKLENLIDRDLGQWKR